VAAALAVAAGLTAFATLGKENPGHRD
jgi:hypothetical protein